MPERLREKGVFDKMKWYLAQFPHHTYTLTAHGEFPVASYVNLRSASGGTATGSRSYWLD